MVHDNKQSEELGACEGTPFLALPAGITPRLYTAASCVRKGSSCVDVGTDHGYLAAYLYKSGISTSVIAADINEKPLEAARRTLKDEGIIDKVGLCLSDGLREIEPELAKDIIICGMGGELILHILLDVSFTREQSRRFVLQPMTNIPLLRRGLYTSGFCIEKEIPVLEGKRGYTVMQVAYTGECTAISDFFALTGKLIESDSVDRDGVLKILLTREKRVLSGILQAAARDEAAISLHERMVAQLDKILNTEGENP